MEDLSLSLHPAPPGAAAHLQRAAAEPGLAALLSGDRWQPTRVERAAALSDDGAASRPSWTTCRRRPLLRAPERSLGRLEASPRLGSSPEAVPKWRGFPLATTIRQLTLLAALTLASKSLSDAPVAIPGLCLPASPLRLGWPALCPAALAATERALLHLLDFRTTVDAAEYAHAALGRAAERDEDFCA